MCGLVAALADLPERGEPGVDRVPKLAGDDEVGYRDVAGRFAAPTDGGHTVRDAADVVDVRAGLADRLDGRTPAHPRAGDADGLIGLVLEVQTPPRGALPELCVLFGQPRAKLRIIDLFQEQIQGRGVALTLRGHPSNLSGASTLPQPARPASRMRTRSRRPICA